jgi:uroporphyrinogen III methyltransferase/synthase
MSARATVYLIGTGPGDPGLLTVRGLELLRRADVVIHDDLVPRAILDQAPRDAERIAVGRAAPSRDAEAAISYLLAEKAREGKAVARLKWGDPFVFDNGGEEALYLHEQGVPFEIVPGVPPGTAVPAYAGIPVTYPGGGDTLTFVRGFEDEQRAPAGIDWETLARLDGTVVVYAGGHQVPRLLEAAQRRGWSPDDRAAVIYQGSTPAQETLDGTLAALTRQLQQQPRRAPAMLVLGRVVGFREHLRWYDTRPLFGRRILVTRPREQSADLLQHLTALGAEPVEAPMIRIVPPGDLGPLRRAVDAATEYDVIVFTSSNAVDAVMRVLVETRRDVRALAGPLLCAVGSSTADRLARHGIRVDLTPDEFRAEGLVVALQQRRPLQDARVLVPHADIAREALADGLREAGAEVTEVVAYRTVPEEPARAERGADIYGMLLNRQIDAVTFASPSAVTNFARAFGRDQAADLLAHTVVASIGPVTSDAIRRLGVPVTVQPSTYTATAMADALGEYFARGAAAATASS